MQPSPSSPGELSPWLERGKPELTCGQLILGHSVFIVTTKSTSWNFSHL